MIYNNGINRCTIFNKPFEKCGKEDKIKKILEIPKLMGFFMYQFPKKDQINNNQTNYESKEFYKLYLDEINELKRIIQDLNQSNDLIQISFPDEATDTLTKACSFCEIARSYDFGILLMTPANTNAFLEAGMFMSLGKRVIFLNNDLYPIKPSFDTTSYFYIHYSSIDEIEMRWNKKMPNFLDELLKNYLEFEISFIHVEEINDEVHVDTDLINSYIDMLEKGEVRPSMIYGRYNAVKNECYSISLRKELNEEILDCVSKISKYFCKVISNEDKELLKIILESLEHFTKKPSLFDILKENCDLNKLIAIFEGGNRDSNLLSILFEFGYFSNIVLRIINALDEKDIKLVNELTIIVWREHLQNEKNELLKLFNKKINKYDSERDKRIMEFIEKLISNLESKRGIWATPEY